VDPGILLESGRACDGAVCGCPRWVARHVLYPVACPDVAYGASDQKRETVMTTPQDTEHYLRRTAVDAEGNRIGKITKVYLDDQAGQPEWILVETGLFGTRQSFAPIRGSRFDGDQLVVLAVSKDQVKDAPNIDPDARISDSEVDALRQYYSA
jgi:hypothetical protein